MPQFDAYEDLVGKWIGSSSATLLCVERDPEACHRSLIAAHLERDWGFNARHLHPEPAAS